VTLALFDEEHIEVDDRDSWCTPQEIVDAVLRLWPGGIDLDPCSNARSLVPARKRYTVAQCIEPEDQEWSGRVYCNPPFSDTGPWAKRMAAHEGGVVGCLLCDPSVSWWKDVWTADAICFPDHRIKFSPPPGVVEAAMQTRRSWSFDRPIALPYWGVRPDLFRSAFSPLGRVIRP